MIGPLSVGSRLVDFEMGELDEDEALDLFAELVRTGMAWHLQGFYGRTAAGLIDRGLLSEFGDRIDTVLVGEVVDTD